MCRKTHFFINFKDFEGHLNEKENYIRSLEEKIQQLQATSAPDDLVLTVGHPNDETDPNSATAIHKTPVADHTIGVGYHTLPHVLFKATPEIIGSSAYAGGYTSPLTSANQCLSLDVGKSVGDNRELEFLIYSLLCKSS